jgi:hypothetical protein
VPGERSAGALRRSGWCCSFRGRLRPFLGTVTRPQVAGLVVQVQLTRASRPDDDELRQGAVSDLPGAVHYHDTGIRQCRDGHLLGMPREQANPDVHRATLPQLTPRAWATCRYLGERSAGYLVGVLPRAIGRSAASGLRSIGRPIRPIDVLKRSHLAAPS